MRNYAEKAVEIDQEAQDRERLKELGVTVVEPTDFRIRPADQIDFSAFGEQEADLRRIYKNLETWMRLPFLVDTFTDHLQRREWRKSLSAHDKRLVEQNKLRSNPITTVILNLQLLPEHLRSVAPDRAKQVQGVLNREPSAMSLAGQLPKTEGAEQRKDILMKLEERIAQVLVLLSAPLAKRAVVAKPTKKAG